jgi:hypothetical protein
LQADKDSVRAAGLSKGQIVEIVAVVAENVFTNLINNVAETDVDFPESEAVLVPRTSREAAVWPTMSHGNVDASSPR